MSASQIFKRIVIPCAVGVTSAPETHTYGRNCNKKTEQGTKPSELPIYTKPPCNVCKEEQKEPPPPSSMEEAVGNIRKELWVWQDNMKGYRHKVVDVYQKGFSKADSVIVYLREPAHGPQRMGAIAIAGLAGYIMGLRHCGRLRKFLYALGGATAMAAICYPKEAVDYLETVVLELRRYFIIAYHFIHGESPQMPDWLEKFVGAKTLQEREQEKAAKSNDLLNLDVEKILGAEKAKDEEKKKS